MPPSQVSSKPSHNSNEEHSLSETILENQNGSLQTISTFLHVTWFLVLNICLQFLKHCLLCSFCCATGKCTGKIKSRGLSDKTSIVSQQFFPSKDRYLLGQFDFENFPTFGKLLPFQPLGSWLMVLVLKRILQLPTTLRAFPSLCPPVE